MLIRHANRKQECLKTQYLLYFFILPLKLTAFKMAAVAKQLQEKIYIYFENTNRYF